MRRHLWLLMTVLGLGLGYTAERGQADHVVVVVWDGMRPDFITPQYTPALFELARQGTFFARNHAVYVSTTEVNDTSAAAAKAHVESGPGQ